MSAPPPYPGSPQTAHRHPAHRPETLPTKRATFPSSKPPVSMLHIRESDWYEHRCLKGFDPPANLHVFSPGCIEIDRMIGFRDWLRTHEDDRALYESTNAASPPSNGNSSRTMPTTNPKSSKKSAIRAGLPARELNEAIGGSRTDRIGSIPLWLPLVETRNFEAGAKLTSKPFQAPRQTDDNASKIENFFGDSFAKVYTEFLHSFAQIPKPGSGLGSFWDTPCIPSRSLTNPRLYEIHPH